MKPAFPGPLKYILVTLLLLFLGHSGCTGKAESRTGCGSNSDCGEGRCVKNVCRSKSYIDDTPMADKPEAIKKK